MTWIPCTRCHQVTCICDRSNEHRQAYPNVQPHTTHGPEYVKVTGPTPTPLQTAYELDQKALRARIEQVSQDASGGLQRLEQSIGLVLDEVRAANSRINDAHNRINGLGEKLNAALERIGKLEAAEARATANRIFEKPGGVEVRNVRIDAPPWPVQTVRMDPKSGDVAAYASNPDTCSPPWHKPLPPELEKVSKEIAAELWGTHPRNPDVAVRADEATKTTVKLREEFRKLIKRHQKEWRARSSSDGDRRDWDGAGQSEGALEGLRRLMEEFKRGDMFSLKHAVDADSEDE